MTGPNSRLAKSGTRFPQAELMKRVRDAGVDNVRTILALPDDPLLPKASVDRVFICDTWHHIEDRPAYLAVLKRMLKPGGQVVHIDFQKRDRRYGGIRDQVRR